MKFSFSLVTLIMIILTIGCAGSDSQSGSTTDSTGSTTTNPLLTDWGTPFGVPPFGMPALGVDTALTVGDVDNTHLASATVSIGSG